MRILISSLTCAVLLASVAMMSTDADAKTCKLKGTARGSTVVCK